MRFGFWLSLLLGAFLCTQVAAAQATNAPAQAEARMVDMRIPSVRRGPDPGAFARGSAMFGAMSGALLLGGSIAIAVVDDLESERITRGVWLGVAAFSTPFVALAGWTARKRTKVKGYQPIRLLGWTSWAFALCNGTLQLYEAFRDDAQHPGVTIGLGVLGALGVWPMAFDAYVSGRRATRARLRFTLGPGSARVVF